MKRKLFIIVFTFVFLCIPHVVKADYEAVITGSSVRLRAEANTSGKVLYNVNQGTSIKVEDKTTISGSGCNNGWLKITYKEKTCYVCSSYVKYISSSFEGINVTDWEARVDGNNVAVREKANVSSDKQATLSLGVNVTILEEVTGNTTSCSSGKWYKIKYNGNKTGYICAKYVTKKQDIISSDEAYASELKAEGFPDSYIPYLTYLHSKYPAWSFKAKTVNKSFSYSVSAEEGKCYMQTTNNNYRTSTTPAEGNSWYKVNSSVIAFYMDPRNWLTEERIFMFEKLDYSSELEEKYLDMVKSIFGSGKLADEKYTIPMVNAGKTNKISPVAIASRIRLEVSANGSDSTSGEEFTFKGNKYSGYYNFFNIGAYEDTVQGVKVNSVLRGLLYAAKVINRSGEKWDNIETAITEGSSFLANGYINKGQGTIYYQKFNVSPSSSYTNYTHQYMTNIQAPAIEGNEAYSAYKSAGMLSEGFIFEIPVYTGLPDYTSLPGVGDTNNNLKSITASGNMKPDFDEDILSYDIYVPTTMNKITINAETSSSLATLTGTGEYELIDSETDITLTVTSQTNVEKKYVITVKKIDDTTASNDVISASTLKTQSDYLYNIKNNTTAKSVKDSLISYGAKSVVIKNTSGVEISDNDIIGTGYKITISTLVDSLTNTVVITGDTSGDGKVTILDLLQVQKDIKNVNKLKDANSYAGDTSGDGKITILDLLQIQKHIKGVKSL